MRKIIIILIIELLLARVGLFADRNNLNARKDGNILVSIDTSEYFDKLLGGWVGQMAGVSWGAPTEFNYQGSIIPENEVPAWSPDMINNAFGQDDIYVEVPFMDAMKAQGILCNWNLFGEYFRNTSFGLWHANKAGRDNLRSGIQAPESGHYSHNNHCDDIDWQIEADFIGMICPGQPNSAADIAWRAGHVMNYGDGVYGGVFVTAMHSAAFTASSLDEVIEAGRNAVPVGSKFRDVIEDVIAWKNAGHTWEQTWNNLQDKWGSDDRCPDGKGGMFNIDSKLNSAYILIGLLYGKGDFEESVRITMRCGQDSDCNPSSVGGILGNWLGLSKMPDQWKSALDRSNSKFSNTEYTFDDLINLSIDLSKKILIFNGGAISDSTWTLPVQEHLPLILEQWPESSNPLPVLQAEIISIDSNIVHFKANAEDSNGILSYQWFFGDLTFSNGAEIIHTYEHFGLYDVICYVTDSIGNTAYQSLTLELNDPALPVIRMYAVDSFINEGASTPGTFRFLREGFPERKVIVHYSVGGTAINGANYQYIPDSVIIPPDQLSGELLVYPIDDQTKKSDKVVQISIKADPNYNIGIEKSQNIIIQDNDTLNVPLEPGLVAYWNFNEIEGEAVTDLSGNGFDGYFVGNVSRVQGKFGNAVSFSGTNSSHVEVPESILGEGLIFNSSDSWSISLWVKLPSIPSVWTTVIAKSRDKDGHYGIWLAPNGQETWTYGGWPNYGSAITQSYVNIWTHLAVVQDGNLGTITGYLNSRVDFTGGDPRPMTGTGDLWMGGAKSVNEWLTGSLDEVRIYNRALSPDEVQALYTYIPIGMKNLSSDAADGVDLYQNYPNPFEHNTTISFFLAENSNVTIRVYDILGRQVARPVDEVRPAGWNDIQFDSGSMKTGIYMYRMIVDNHIFTRKMQIVN